jgi:hypothetical protein
MRRASAMMTDKTDNDDGDSYRVDVIEPLDGG